jgi:hypothetical protein
MARATPDDLEAVRAVVAALEAFEAKDQERVLRWAREKLGLTAAATTPDKDLGSETAAGEPSIAAPPAKSADIRTFIQYKNPQSDIQFAAAVAYYHRFEAPPPQRKEAITSADLQEACRQIGRTRINHPAQTLINAHGQGYLDRGAERGTYVLNTVGENLVAMALPEAAKSGPVATIARRKSRKKASPRSKGRKRAR